MSIQPTNNQTAVSHVGQSEPNQPIDQVSETAIACLDLPVQTRKMGSYEFEVMEIPNECLVMVLVYLEDETLLNLRFVSTTWENGAITALNEKKFGKLKAFIQIFFPFFQNRTSLFKMDKNHLFSLPNLMATEQYISKAVCQFELEHYRLFSKEASFCQEQNKKIPKIHQALIKLKTDETDGLPSEKILKLCASAFAGKLSAHVLTYGEEIEGVTQKLNLKYADDKDELTTQIEKLRAAKIEKLKVQLDTLVQIGEFSKAIDIVEIVAKNVATQTFLLDFIKAVFYKIFSKKFSQDRVDLEKNRLMERLFATAPLAETMDQYVKIGVPIRDLRIHLYNSYLMFSKTTEPLLKVLSLIDDLMKRYEEAAFFQRSPEQSDYYVNCFSVFLDKQHGCDLSNAEIRWGLYEKLPNPVARLCFLMSLSCRSSDTDHSELFNTILAYQSEIVPELEIEKSLDVALCIDLLRAIAGTETLHLPSIYQVLERISFYKYQPNMIVTIPIHDLEKILAALEPNEKIDFALQTIKDTLHTIRMLGAAAEQDEEGADEDAFL